MATNCYNGRRLSELLQEQQEPFLVHRGAGALLQCRRAAEACGRRLCDYRRGVGIRNRAKAVTVRKKAPLWDLAGCLSCAGGRERFRRLPRSGDIRGDDVRKLSPVSVLQPRSDEDSTELSHWDEDDSKPSTSSAISPSSPGDDAAASPRSTIDGRSDATEETTTEQQAVLVSAWWERIAADVSKLVETDLFGSSARDWRRRVGEEKEARRVGESVEAMIFEEVRWEAVRDMFFSDSPSHVLKW